MERLCDLAANHLRTTWGGTGERDTYPARGEARQYWWSQHPDGIGPLPAANWWWDWKLLMDSTDILKDGERRPAVFVGATSDSGALAGLDDGVKESLAAAGFDLLVPGGRMATVITSSNTGTSAPSSSAAVSLQHRRRRLRAGSRAHSANCNKPRFPRHSREQRGRPLARPRLARPGRRPMLFTERLPTSHRNQRCLGQEHPRRQALLARLFHRQSMGALIRHARFPLIAALSLSPEAAAVPPGKSPARMDGTVE